MKRYISFFKNTSINPFFFLKKGIFYCLKLLFFALFLSVPLLGADYFFHWLGIYIQPCFHKDSFFLAVALSFFLIQVKNNGVFFLLFSVLLLIIYAGFFHYLFFGRYFTGYDIALFFNEFQDTALAFFDDFIAYWPLFVWMLFCVVFMLCIRCFANRYIKQSNWFIWLIILSLAIIPIQNIKRGGEFSFPNATQFVYFNGLKSVSSYFVDVLISKKEQKSFLPYRVELKNPSSDPMTIVYIMGEGLSADHLSLFGYKRKTTPYLDDWAK